jgi:hypothetical protein
MSVTVVSQLQEALNTAGALVRRVVGTFQAMGHAERCVDVV